MSQPADYRTHFDDTELIEMLAGTQSLPPNAKGFFDSLPRPERERLQAEAMKIIEEKK